MRRYVVIGAVLIGVYLVLANYKGARADAEAAAAGSTNLVKAFQGR